LPCVQVLLFACDMGGMGYIAANEAHLMVCNTLITANTVRACKAVGAALLLLASSACVYPEDVQMACAAGAGPAPMLKEDDAWPAQVRGRPRST
jgi:nucleoside-diphosphate-sugar epimerase